MLGFIGLSYRILSSGDLGFEALGFGLWTSCLQTFGPSTIAVKDFFEMLYWVVLWDPFINFPY